MCQDILSVSTTCFCDNREMRVHFHGINKNIVVIYRVGLNSKLGHCEALSGWTEIAATSVLFLSHWDWYNHALWLPGQIWGLGCQGAWVFWRPLFWNSLRFPPQHIQDLQALRSYKESKKGIFVSFLTGVGFQMVLKAIIGWEETLVCVSVLSLCPQTWQMVPFEYLGK